MNTEQILWGAVAILAVFVLNQVFGRILAQFIGGKATRDADQYVGRREHSMCSNHTTQQMEALVARFDSWEHTNQTDHANLFGKLDELKTLILSQNGKH